MTSLKRQIKATSRVDQEYQEYKVIFFDLHTRDFWIQTIKRRSMKDARGYGKDIERHSDSLRFWRCEQWNGDGFYAG